MSEYQYYDFRTVDRRLSPAEQKQLRAISSRARITETRFVNHYDFGDFGGDPDRLMERHFDLFLYFPNWGARRFSMRLPKGMLEQSAAKPFLAGDEATLRTASGSLILDVCREEIEADHDDDGSEWLDGLAPLRADVLEGDLPLFYLIWLMGVETGEVPDSAAEPLAGLAPLSNALDTFVDFFRIDRDLVDAALAVTPVAPSAPADGGQLIARLDEAEKTSLLVRLHEGDPYVRAELRRRCRALAGDTSADGRRRRTAGELRAVAQRLEEERRRAEEARLAAERRRQEKKEAKAREARLEALAQRGEAAWREVETLIEARAMKAYANAAVLLVDLRELALHHDTDDEFHRRVADIRSRHKAKPRLIAQLAAAGVD